MTLRGSERSLLLVACGLLLLPGCRFTAPDPGRDDTPTSGRVLILADVDCKAVIEEEAMVFRNIYKDAEMDIRYMNEAQLLRSMMNDSVRCVITTVAPGGAQQAYYDKRRISTPIVPIYKAGIAVVVNKQSPLGHLDLRAIAELLGGASGKTEGTSPGATAAATDLRALFAGAGSGVARLLVDSLHLGPLRAQALADVPAVIAQVARDPLAVGFVPFEAISDLDNPAMRMLRDQVRLLPIARHPEGNPVPLTQASLADGSYPLQRTVNMMVTEGKTGLGTGFVSFVANHKGQRIILKLGVAPITVPPRNVEIVPQ